MTQSLTERLAERLSTQSAEIERLTANELARLGQSLTRESEAALASMQSAMAASIESTTQPLLRDLARLRRIGRWWWSALALTWLAIAGLTGFSLWLWASPPGSWGTGESVRLATFTQGGETYAMLPEGARVWTCRQSEARVPCIRLPSRAALTGSRGGATSAPDLERGAGTDGRSAGAPSVRPPVRPSGS